MQHNITLRDLVDQAGLCHAVQSLPSTSLHVLYQSLDISHLSLARSTEAEEPTMPDRYLAASLFFVSAVVLFIAGVLFGVDAVYRDCCQKELKRAGLAMNLIATAFLMAATLANWNYNGPMATKWTKGQRIRCCSKLLPALFTIGSSIAITVLSGYLLKEDACNWSGFKLTKGLAPVALSLRSHCCIAARAGGTEPSGEDCGHSARSGGSVCCGPAGTACCCCWRSRRRHSLVLLASSAAGPEAAAGTTWACWAAASCSCWAV